MSDTTDLEIRIAYQDRQIEALDEVVRDFTTRVETLERQLARLQEQLRQLRPGDDIPHDVKPPHYS